MYVQVKLLRGYQKALIYKIPATWSCDDLDGSIITVPLKNNIVPAIVIKVHKNRPADSTFEIKEAVGRDHLPDDPYYKIFIEKMSQFYFAPKKLFFLRMRQFIHTKEKKESRGKTEGSQEKTTPQVTLTDEQKSVVDYIVPRIKSPQYTPTLLHGVTGSGKTEIYKKVITSCIEQNKSVILLLPEVSLSIQFEHLLSKQLPKNIPIFSFHSATKAKDKKTLWDNLINKKPSLTIGVHLPVMLPIPNLGCIIIDEEHEPGFQEKKHPKVNSKEMAIWRAKLYNIPIILGSATPSINSLYNVKKHNWKLCRLTKRFSGIFPKIKTVKMSDLQTGRRRKNFWITRELENAINDRLTKKEQTIIYLNRRGHSFFVQCKKCGFTFTCPNCSVSLTLHRKSQNSHLSCHYCDHKQPNPTQCNECSAGEKDLLKRGVGTQQMVTILEKIFPTATIARADLDTTKKKREWKETVEKFERGDIDILVGTQTITKGYHFPNVTLVGIIWADLNVHFPVFNASETTLQQLIQVAGRAGRSTTESLVIAQIIHDHPIFDYLNEENYLTFCKKEMEFRQETEYPPFGRFLQIEIKNDKTTQIDDDSQKLFDTLYETCENQNLDISILGPAKPLVHRIQKTEIRHIFLKAKDFKEVYGLLKSINLDVFESNIYIVPTP